MANVATPSGLSRRGDVLIGTGLGMSSFASTVALPTDNSGNVLPGYTFQTSTTATNGIAWNFTGDGGQEITRFQYPSNCPVPFPDPVTLNTDLVLITREDTVANPRSGLIDIYMPTVGVQGRMPTHSLPPLTDATNQVAFFFDDANAAINVYQVVSATWVMGWVRATPSATFRWRAADIYSAEKINLNQAYPAPFNTVGLWFSCVSPQFSSVGGAVTPTPLPQAGDARLFGTNNLWFLNYAMNANFTIISPLLTGGLQGTGALFRISQSGTIIANLIIQERFQSTRDVAVSAICVPPLSAYFFNGNSVSTTRIVCAVAFGSDNALAPVGLGNNAWWGYVALTNYTNTNAFSPINVSNVWDFVNPLLPDLNGPSPNQIQQSYQNYRVTGEGGTPNPLPFIRTISYGGAYNQALNTQEIGPFFIGGNYLEIFFNGSVQIQAITGRRARVAMQFDPLATARTNDQRYDWIGGVNGVWTGQVVQSNCSPDGYFVYGGNFLSPPSSFSGTTLLGPQFSTIPAVTFVPPTVQTSSQNVTVSPSLSLQPTNEQVGGRIASMQLVFGDINGTPFPSSGLSTSLNSYCLSFSPNQGDIRESSFPPIVMGGNFLQPTSYITTSAYTFQTQTSIVGTGWWYGYVSIWVENDILVPFLDAYIYPDNANTFSAPLQFRHYDFQLRRGKNYIPILGGANVPLSGRPGFGTGGNRFNSNIPIDGAVTQFDSFQRSFFMSLLFFATATTPLQVRIGTNNSNQRRYPGCWTLEGYPIDYNIANFSSATFAAGEATQTVTSFSPPQPPRRTVTYANNVLRYNVTTNRPINVFIIPINFLNTLNIYSQSPALPADRLNAGFFGNISIRTDPQGSFAFSAMNLARNPGTLYKVPSFLNITGTLPSTSIFAKSRYEVYKISNDAAADNSSLGIYTNFDDFTDLAFLFVAPPGLSLVAGQAALTTNNLSAPGQLRINTLNPSGEPGPQFDYAANVRVGDIITVTSVTPQNGFLPQVVYRVISLAGVVSAFVIQWDVVFVSTTFANPIQPLLGQTTVDFTLTRDTVQTPFVLKQNSGPYVIGNGTDARLKDVYIAPTLTTQERAYRYVPDYETNFLQFNTTIQQGTPTIDDTLVGDTVLFNSNSSSILLSKASSNLGGNTVWNVVSTSGNVTLNTQRA